MAAKGEEGAPVVHDFGEFTGEDYEELDEHGFPLLLSAALDISIALHAEEDEEEKEKEKAYAEEEEDDNSLDDEDDDNNIVEDYLDPYMDQDHPDRMKLTTVELNWILNIKIAIENDPELDNLSDFMYSQLGIICEGDVADAMERARGLQVFRQEYGVVDSYQEGRRALQEVVKLQPLVFLAWNFSNIDGTWLSVSDMAKTDLSALDTEAKLRQYFIAYYYLHHCWSPDLETIRKGSISVVECEGLGLSIKNNFKVWMRMGEECLQYYPSINLVKHYNTGMLFNVLLSMAQKLMPKEKAERFQVGLTSSCRMDSVLLVPNTDVATQKMLTNMTGCLERRFQNEEQFSLPASADDRSTGPSEDL